MTDIWARIAKLRISDPELLAPVVKDSVLRSLASVDAEVVTVTYAGVSHDIPLKAKIVETLRVQELQSIYFDQKASKVKDVMYGQHAYGVAVDLVSVEYDWFTGSAAIKRWPDKKTREAVSLLWYRKLAEAMTADKTMAWGGLWKSFPDSPHFQSARVPVTPSATMRDKYNQAGGGEAGRKEVWKMYKLDVSTPVIA